MKKGIWLLVFISTVTLFDNRSFAQFEGEDETESLYDKAEEQETRRQQLPPRRSENDQKEASSLTELAELAPFSDVAVISRKFLPKTNRFEVSGSLALGLNNEFFNNLGAGLRAAYYFSEKYGIEGMYFFLTDAEKDITTRLKDKVNIEAKSLVRSEGFLGLTFKWMPIYGKLAFMERKIVSYDIYFQGGLAMNQTAEGSEPGATLGAGQIFALSKSMAVRWDFTWNFYQATIREGSGAQARETTTNQNDLIVSVGVSFFFPEASYR